MAGEENVTTKQEGWQRRAQAKSFVNKRFYDQSFERQELVHADFRGATLANCNFDHADLSYASFEGANCYGSSFRQTRLYRTNFKDAVLAETIMDPRDMFGLTLTLTCDTFDRAKLSGIWPVAWLYMITLAEMPKELHEKVIALLVDHIGEERYKGLEKAFRERSI